MCLVQKTIFFTNCQRERGLYVPRLGQQFSLYTFSWAPARIIDFCELNEIENEITFTLGCPFYNDLRLRLLKKVEVHYADALYCIV